MEVLQTCAMLCNFQSFYAWRKYSSRSEWQVKSPRSSLPTEHRLCAHFVPHQHWLLMWFYSMLQWCQRETAPYLVPFLHWLALPHTHRQTVKQRKLWLLFSQHTVLPVLQYDKFLTQIRYGIVTVLSWSLINFLCLNSSSWEFCSLDPIKKSPIYSNSNHNYYTPWESC